MRRPGGWTFETTPDGKVIEGESWTCRHCNRVSFIAPRQRPEDIGGHCRSCHGLICPRCIAKMDAGADCEPLEKWLEKVNENYRRLVSRGEIHSTG